MAFQQFVPTNKGKNTLDGYSLNITQRKSGFYTGQINFGGVMQENLELDKYKYLELFTDKENKLIAIRRTNKKSNATRAIRMNGTRAFMTCTSWLYTAKYELGYPATGKGGYRLIEGGLIILEKPKRSNQ